MHERATSINTLFPILFVEYAVCTKEKILLYDNKWSQLEPTVTKDYLKNMKAITFDPVHDVFYFTDRLHETTSIFSLKVRQDTTFLVEPLVNRTENEAIQDLVYDFHDDALYWSDSGNKKIVKLIFDRSKNLKWRTESFLNITGDVAGLEIDSCRRNLYYTIVTKDSPSINMVSLDMKGAQPVSFGNKNHYEPTAIALDHQARRLYVGDIGEYTQYSIDSLATDGTDFQNEIKYSGKTPRSIAVDGDYVYYVEGSSHELRRFKKDVGKKKSSEVVFKMVFDPNDIIVRNNFITDLDPKKCKVSQAKMETVKKEIETSVQKMTTSKMCLHDGSLEKTTNNCMCRNGYDGDYCEISLCYNFCLNGGECSMKYSEISRRDEPGCSCTRGFDGKHCEVNVCSNFCLNDGRCSVDASRKPKCGCNEKFDGARCENLKVEVSLTIIKSHDVERKEAELSTSSENPTTKVPEHEELEQPHEMSESLTKSHEEETARELQNCKSNAVNLTSVILAICFTISLLIFLIILVVIKKFSRPMRPKIRKKYVVHKNIEPLTYRPTTEQCEVIIEDCCNMNICETVSYIELHKYL